MDSAPCPRCDAEDQSGNFCTACAYDLRPPVITPRHRAATAPPEVEASTVTCAQCGALNAASRRVCARCHTVLAEDERETERTVPSAPVQESFGFGPPVRVRGAGRSPKVLLVALAVAALVVIGVTGTLLAARGIGPFGSAETSTGPTAALQIARVRASSALGGSPAGAAFDGDATTVWVDGASGSGTGEWLEVDLRTRARVRRLLVWNGDQREAEFLRRNRVRALRIEIGRERFTVELLDEGGPQVVELPRPIDGARLRLIVDSVYPGRLRGETAISDIELFGTALD